jgi:hypothetical protein
MSNKYILLITASLVFVTFLLGCGNGGSNPYSSPNVAETWNGIWVSSKVISSGTISMTITHSDTAFSGSITMSGSPCFSTATIADWTVAGDTVSWSSPEIGNFTGTISGATISGTYSVTSAGACFGDTGIFSVTST